MAVAETFDGTSWTEVGDLNTVRRAVGSVGSTNTAALAVAGVTTGVQAGVESWNGQHGLK